MIAPKVPRTVAPSPLGLCAVAACLLLLAATAVHLAPRGTPPTYSSLRTHSVPSSNVTLLPPLVPGWPPMVSRETTTDPPFRIQCVSGDLVCIDIMTSGVRVEWNYGLGSLVTALRPGVDTMVDLGANTGFFGLAAAARGVRTISVEPVQGAVVRANAVQNGFAPPLFTLHEVALVAERGTPPQRMRMPWGNMGSASLVAPGTTQNWTSLFTDATPHLDIEAPTSTLDDLLATPVLNPRAIVALLKIDTEGWEYFVFKGGQQTLASGLVRTIVSEWHPRFLVSAGVDPLAYLHLFINAGFVMFPALAAGTAPLSAADVEPWARKHATTVADIRFETSRPWPPSGATVASGGPAEA